MLNGDQQDWMRYLAALSTEATCDCGWYLRGECCGLCYGDAAKGGYVQVERGEEQGE